MARRRQGVAEDIMDLVATLPWWLGVLLAVSSYPFFNWLATSGQPSLTQPRDVAGALPGMMIAAASMVLQYVAPVLCLASAGISFVRRKKRQALAAGVTASPSAQSLEGMSWREFEMLVGEAFRLQGYQVQEQGGAQPDGGVDLVLRKGSETWLVQCKQWKAFKVGVDVVRELYGVMAAQGAAGGFVVTSGRFTDDAVAFASGRNVRLVDGPRLFGLLQQARAALSGQQQRAHRLATPPPVQAPSTVLQADAAPSCPKCSAPMVRRTARKGANPGAQFWGCSTYPACRGTR